MRAKRSRLPLIRILRALIHWVEGFQGLLYAAREGWGEVKRVKTGEGFPFSGYLFMVLCC